MNKYVQTVIIIISVTLGLGVVFTIFLEQSNTTVPVPLNPDKTPIYLEKGCTEEAIEFINGDHPQEITGSLENEAEKCLRIIIEEN